MSSLKRKAKEGIGFLSLAFGIAVITTPLAWFANGTDLNPQVSASSKNAYFAAGDGTAAHPFELTSAIHYYNLCWLQYLGRFNQISGATVKQVYFQLDNDIDLTHISASDTRALLLPPIGTSRYPFIGNFNGQGHTLTNLSVTNSATLSDYPIHPYLSDGVKNLECLGVFGVAGTTESTSTVNGLTTSGTDESHTYDPAVNIIKDLNLTNISVKATTNQTLIGIGVGYNNATLEHIGVGTGCKLNVSSSTSATSYTSNLSDSALVGYTAKKEDTSLREDEAYVPYVDNPNNAQGGSGFGSSIDMQTMYNFLYHLRNGTQLGSNGTTYSSPVFSNYPQTRTIDKDSDGNVISDVYSDYVDCAMKANGNGSYDKHSSIAIYDDKTDVKKESNKKYSSITYAREYDEYGDQDEETSEGRSYVLLYGDASSKETCNVKETSSNIGQTTTGLYLKTSSGAFLKFSLSGSSETYTLSYSEVSSFEKASTFSYSNGALSLSGTYSYRSGWSTKTKKVTLYIYCDSNGSLATTDNSVPSSYPWTNVNGYLSRTINSNSYYCSFSGSTFSTATNTTNAITVKTGSTYTENHTVNTPATYYPLSMAGHFSTDSKGNTNIDADNYGDGTPYEKNTGYIVGGTKTAEAGDIRVSKFLMEDLTNSLGHSQTSYDDSYVNIITRNMVQSDSGTISDSDWSVIDDTHNKGTSAISDDLNGLSGGRKNYKTGLHLKRYSSSRDAIQQVFTEDSTGVYGLHFVTASSELALDKYTTEIEHAEILDGKTTRPLDKNDPDSKTMAVTSTYYNMKVPKDSIDCNLMQSGYISFYSGSYYVNNSETYTNDSFFSLNEIKRPVTTPGSSSYPLTSVTRIQKIYTDPDSTDETKPYIYSYDGNDPTSGRGQLIFDCSWIEAGMKTEGKWINNALYYFEIPVNKGEYALSAVSGHNGAYLIYLDIGAGTNYRKVTVKEKVYTQLKKTSFVTGIDFLVDPTKLSSVTGGQTANVAITSVSSAIYSFTPTADGLTIDQPSTSLSLEYEKSGYPVTASDTALSYSSSKNTYNMTEEKTTTIQYNGSGTETRTTEVTFTLKNATSGTKILLPTPIKTRDNAKDSITYTLNNDAVYAVDSSSASYATIDSTARTITLSADAPSTGVIFTLKYSEVSTEWQDKWYGPHNDELNKDGFATSMVKYHFTDTSTDSKSNATVNYQYSYVRTDDSDEGGTFTYYLTVNSPLATTLVIDSLPPTSSTFTYQVIIYDGTTATTVSTVGQTISIAAAA